MPKDRWRVGELAKAAGLTVRALYHYHDVGLLTPSGRTHAGHRLYTAADVGRLYRILALRELGLGFTQIRAVLDQDTDDLRAVVRWHLHEIERQLAAHARLAGRLRQILDALGRMEQPSTDSLIHAMEAMAMFERYLTPEQIAQLQERHRALGDEAVTQGAQEWLALIAEAEAARRAGLDPASPQVRNIARRWKDVIDRFTGGDEDILGSLMTMIETEGIETVSRGTVTPALREYMSASLSSA